MSCRSLAERSLTRAIHALEHNRSHAKNIIGESISISITPFGTYRSHASFHNYVATDIATQ